MKLFSYTAKNGIRRNVNFGMMVGIMPYADSSRPWHFFCNWIWSVLPWFFVTWGSTEAYYKDLGWGE